MNHADLLPRAAATAANTKTRLYVVLTCLLTLSVLIHLNGFPYETPFDADRYVAPLAPPMRPAAPLADTVDNTLLAYIREQCDGLDRVMAEIPLSWKRMYLAPKYNLAYCTVPKIASTTWKRALVALGKAPPDGKVDMKQFDVLPRGFVHIDRNVGPYLRLASDVIEDKSKIATVLDSYTAFMFARHPFTRLLSAYRDKVADDADSPSYRRLLFPRLSDVRRRHADASPGPPLGRHSSIYIHFDYVGKYETLSDDSAELLRRTNLDDVIVFPERNASYKRATSSDDVTLMREFYGRVPLELGRRLYEKYELDFLIFNYTFPEDLFAR
ncbi:PREDICTED: carbohydrate sulfotransferase 11-like [Priapulus caudatus]|uniref:Carbohydrate sulfotransferase n=1 Tax=Priapulus caudatus TaxID=37621 RepID=A0ABM1F5N0_PRICU|nr:PREDICTED: carbohydrate sulfotransferase 11-like [Priapulus caudatus]